MRLWIIFLKTLREMRRDGWVLGLSLAFAPFFVLLYWLFTQGGSTAYAVLVINHDRGATLASGESYYAGEDAVAAIAAVTYADGKPLLKVRPAANREEAEMLLRDRKGVAFVEIPEGFSETMAALQAGNRDASSEITFGGDLTNPYYTVGGVLAIGALDSYVFQTTGQQPLVRYTEAPLKGSAVRTEFEIYTPGILVFAVIMIIFQAAMTVAREIENGTLRRVQITPTSGLDYIGGVTLALVGMGLVALLLAFGTAIMLGFRSQGPLWIAILVGAMTSLAIIGMGMVVASLSRTVSQAFVVANFPMGLLMFFSGAIFPLPKVKLFEIGGTVIGLYDVLPTTHAVAALNKVFTLGAGLEQVVYEMGALILLSVVYFAVGVWLFQRMHLK